MQLLGPLLEPAWHASIIVGGVFVAFLLVQSLRHFSRTGPQLKDEILQHYPGYLTYSIARLTLWAWIVSSLAAGAGALTFTATTVFFDLPRHPIYLVLACTAGIGVVAATQFCEHLLHIPGSIEASSNYRTSRFYPLWEMLTPQRLRNWQTTITASSASLLMATIAKLFAEKDIRSAAWLCVALIGYALLGFMSRNTEPRPIQVTGKPNRPNVLMIGSDTLRADRLGVAGYHRNLTPAIDALSAKGAYFTQCFVPCARTAPSLASIFTGCWPHHHNIRDNFVSDAEARLNTPALPALLRQEGYATIAISDWAGADLGKLSLGFDQCDLPQDQWNIKYLLRQGPKDLRHFLSLFTHNRLGKRLLPELYYLAGVPLTAELGRDARKAISACAANGRSFFLNLFTSTTHGPFGSEYPYYTLFPDPAYSGESKFVMSGLNDPFEIVQKQGKGEESFDFAQILNLYDGCVRNFDDEVAKVLHHLEDCGLAEDTIVIMYSDHGMEFFERDTWGQGNSVIVDESARIPLVIYDPRHKQGKVINQITRSIDIAPTILDLLGLPPCQTMDGTSLTCLTRGSGETSDLYAYMETGIWFTRVPGMHERHLSYPDLPDLLDISDKTTGTIALKKELINQIISAKDRALRSGKWKLVWQPLEDGPLCHLFDIESDPQCRCDVKNEYPHIAQELEYQLQKFLVADTSLNTMLEKSAEMKKSDATIT